MQNAAATPEALALAEQAAAEAMSLAEQAKVGKSIWKGRGGREKKLLCFGIDLVPHA